MATSLPADYEETHVHAVYNQIAPHFSSTRYKPWPLVSSFLLAQEPGSIGLDIGCGNGKYLAVNPSLVILGSDRSIELIGIASKHTASSRQIAGQIDDTSASTSQQLQQPSQHSRPVDVLVADTLALPHPRRRFDFAICVAVVHHLSERDRRIAAIGAILETLIVREGRGAGRGVGRALIYVWALEQKGSRRGWEEGGEQDVLVPWVMRSSQGLGSGLGSSSRLHEGHRGSGDGPQDEKPQSEKPQDRTFLRYYHLYRHGELEEDVEAAGGVVLDSGYEKDNWWAIASPSPAESR